MSELAATALATARFPRHHALRYRAPLATPLATAVAVAIAASSDSALELAVQHGLDMEEESLPPWFRWTQLLCCSCK